MNSISAVKSIRVGVLGCGNVGAPLVGLVARQQAVIEARKGVSLQVVKVAVRDTTKARGIDLPAGALTNDAMAVVNDPDVDVGPRRLRRRRRPGGLPRLRDPVDPHAGHDRHPDLLGERSGQRGLRRRPDRQDRS